MAKIVIRTRDNAYTRIRIMTRQCRMSYDHRASWAWFDQLRARYEGWS